MNPPAAGMNDQPKIAPVYLVFDGEVMLDAPQKDAWRHVIDYPSWQNYSMVKHVSGDPQQEGAITLLQKEGGPPYYARIIKLVPQRRIIWKVYLEKGKQAFELFGTVDFRLHEAQGKTRFCYNMIYEFMVPHRKGSELDEFRKQQLESSEAVFAVYWPTLQQRVRERADLPIARACINRSQ